MDPFLISCDLLCRVCVLLMSVLFQLRITVQNIYKAECVRNHTKWNHETKALVPSFRAGQSVLNSLCRFSPVL